MHNKSSEINKPLRAQFRRDIEMAKRVCFGYNQNEHGNLVINSTRGRENCRSGCSSDICQVPALAKLPDRVIQKGDSVSDRQGKMEPGGDRQIAFQRKIYRRCPLQKTISVMGVQIENTGSTRPIFDEKIRTLLSFR